MFGQTDPRIADATNVGLSEKFEARSSQRGGSKCCPSRMLWSPWSSFWSGRPCVCGRDRRSSKFQDVSTNRGKCWTTSTRGTASPCRSCILFKQYAERIYLIQGHMPGTISLFSGHEPTEGFQTCSNPLFLNICLFTLLNIEFVCCLITSLIHCFGCFHCYHHNCIVDVFHL